MHPHSLIPHLDALYAARTIHPFPESPQAFLDEVEERRRQLADVLAVQPLAILRVEEISRTESDLATAFRYDFFLDDGTILPVRVSKPKRVAPPFRAVVFYHGHANGSQTLFGENMTKPHQDCAVKFVEQGYYVIACDQRGFADRLGPSPVLYNGYTRSCRQLAFDLMLYGRTLLGERVSDGKAIVDYLLAQPDIRKDAIVVTGNSGGGTTSLLHAALDPRIRAAAIGSAFCAFKTSIMELSHCECNYLPGILKSFGEIWDIGALIAPRPLLVIHGQNDKIFPIASVRAAVEKLRAYYDLCGADASLELQEHPGEHRYDHGRVFDFLTEHVYGTRL
jgi:dienelactone hydrolase